MSILGKLAFWKKKDDLEDLGKDLGFEKDLGMDMGPSPDLGMGLNPNQGMNPSPSFQKYPSYSQPSFQPSFQQPSFQSQSPASNDNYINSKNLEVISSKLDALKASLDSINQRLSTIETIARGEQEDRRRRYY